jgi:hypothetical protein
VRDRLLKTSDTNTNTKVTAYKEGTGKAQLRSFLADDHTIEGLNRMSEQNMYQTKPIADLFPEVRTSINERTLSTNLDQSHFLYTLTFLLFCSCYY